MKYVSMNKNDLALVPDRRQVVENVVEPTFQLLVFVPLSSAPQSVLLQPEASPTFGTTSRCNYFG
jgi:hypothetical protein